MLSSSFPARRDMWAALALISLAAMVYWPVGGFSFVNFDDPLYVLENTFVQKGLTFETLIWSFTDATRSTNYFAPLTWITFLIDFELYGLNAGGYHLTNLFFHMANSFLLYLCLRKMTGVAGRSLAVAAIFAVHPLHVESVAWVTERKDMVSTFFWLLSMLAYHRYVLKRGTRAYLAAFLFYGAGILAKPMVVTLPFALLLLDFWPLRRTGLRGPWLRLLVEKTPFFLVSLAAAAAAFATQTSGGAVRSMEVFPLGVRIANTVAGYAGYIAKALWPVDLAVVYPHPGALPAATVLAAAAALVCITVPVILFSRRLPYLPVGWCWFLGTLFPVSGMVVIGPHAVADRYMYVPAIGLLLMAVWGIGDLLRLRGAGARASAAVLVLALLYFTPLAAYQTRFWKGSETLFRRALEVTHRNYLAHYNLAVALQESGRYREAAEHYSAALAIKPDLEKGHANLAVLLHAAGRRDLAFQHLFEALRIAPENPKTHYNLGILFYEQEDFSAAASHLSQALKLKPDYSAARDALRRILQQGISPHGSP